jgi:hypothetical protein
LSIEHMFKTDCNHLKFWENYILLTYLTSVIVSLNIFY